MNETNPKDPVAFSPWRGIGAFFVAFGVCLLVAAFGVTEDTAGQVVNLVCALIFVVVAVCFEVLHRSALREAARAIEADRQAPEES